MASGALRKGDILDILSAFWRNLHTKEKYPRDLYTSGVSKASIKIHCAEQRVSLALCPDPSKLSADPFCIEKRGELEFKLNPTIQHQQGTDSTSTFRTAVRDVPEADSKVSV